MGDGLTLLAVAGFVAAVWLLLEGAEWFTRGVLTSASGLGVAPAAMAFLAGGIDLDNLAVGLASQLGGMPQIATASVVGSTFFFVTAAIGISVLVAPIRARMSPKIAALCFAPSLLVALLALDGSLGRVEGMVVVSAGAAALIAVLSSLHEHRRRPKSGSAPAGVLRLIASLLMITAGAELFEWSIRHILGESGLDQTPFGMVVVGAAVTIEEIPKIIGPLRLGLPQLALANVSGTILFNGGINAGLLAVVAPLPFHESNLHGWTLAWIVATALLLAWHVVRETTRPVGMVLIVVWVVAAIALF